MLLGSPAAGPSWRLVEPFPEGHTVWLQVGEFAKDTGAVCSDGNRFKEHVNSKQHKRAVTKEQELMGIPVSDDTAHLLQVQCSSIALPCSCCWPYRASMGARHWTCHWAQQAHSLCNLYVLSGISSTDLGYSK